MSYISYDGWDQRGPARDRGGWLLRMVLVVLLIVLAGVGVYIAFEALGPSYDGASLAGDVARVVSADGSEPTSVTCQGVSHVRRGVISDCTALIDGQSIGLRVTFDDKNGHFTVMREVQ